MKTSAWKLGFGLLLCALLPASGAQDIISAEFSSVLRSGEVRKLQSALEKGASPRARDAAGNTPLMLAAAYGDSASLRLLLDRGADVNAANKEGATALMRAS